MNRTKVLAALLLIVGFCFSFTAGAAPVEKVLQNGLNDYNGCDDAFVLSKAGFETKNFGTHDSLEIRWDDG